MHHPKAAANTAGHRGAQTLSDVAGALLARLFRRLDHGVALRLWDGRQLRLGQADTPSAAQDFTLVFRSPATVREIVLGRDPLRLAEAYFRGDLDIEGNLFGALALKDHVQQLQLGWSDRLAALRDALTLRWLDPSAGRPGAAGPGLRSQPVTQHSPQENRRAIAFHYDISNDFYALWLDPRMVYSCAYFEHPDSSLEAAQEAKLEHICRKLLLRPGERLLDIGCGWGALVLHAAQHHGVRAHGITLSQRQLEWAQQRIAQQGLQGRASVELRDYRDLPDVPQYDKVASVGMFEHIGLQRLPAYFATVHRVLKDGGLFLNHGITHDEEGWRTTPSSVFINRYVFPDGQLDTVSNIQRGMEQAHFEILDLESLRPHYAKTLRHWVARLEQQHAAALRHVPETTWRIWRLYMAASAMEFETGEIGIYQILTSKRGRGLPPVPLTRGHLYAAPSCP